jgi:hypothetical protein
MDAQLLFLTVFVLIYVVLSFVDICLGLFLDIPDHPPPHFQIPLAPARWGG